MSGKLLFVVMLLLAALAGGLYFAGWLVLKLLHVDAPLALDTWWQYFQALSLPQYAPYAGKVKTAVAIGFGVPLLAWLLLLIPLFKPKPESLHGDASFADLSDAKKAGFLKHTPQGILMGKLKGRLLWLNGTQHLFVTAPTRSGKTTSIAVPVLHTFEHSMVVLDLKGELRKLSSGRRESMGQTIYTWSPYSEKGDGDRFNPFTLLAGINTATRFAEIQSMSAILYPDEPGKDTFWTSQSRAAFTAFAGYLFEAWDVLWQKGLPSDPNTVEGFPSFERVLRFSSGAQGLTTLEMLKAVLADPAQYAFVSPQTLTTFSNLAGLAEQTFSSVIATMQAPLQPFLSPILADATNATDFDITTLRKRPTTLYVDIPTNRLNESRILLNIFFSSVVNNNLTQQLGDTPALKYQMLMLLDEFTAMGRLDVWAKRISISASYGVRSLIIVQSQAQLRSVYGDDDAQNMITNHGGQIVFAAQEQSDANAYSEKLGYKTIRKRHQSRSSGSGSSQVTTNYTEEKRALFLPQEIKELPGDDEIIFYEGAKPTRAKKNWFFKMKMFRKWAAMPPVKLRARVKESAADVENVFRPQKEQTRKWLQ